MAVSLNKLLARWGRECRFQRRLHQEKPLCALDRHIRV